MRDTDAMALAAIRAEYEEEVVYSGDDLPAAPMAAIFADAAAMKFQGSGSTLRQISFEIAQSAIPRPPKKGDIILQGNGDRWKANEKRELDDVAAWLIIVEKAPLP